jgi:mevalonate kinase
MMTQSLSHGKIIWMGEHAVVYGYKAIALPLFQVGVQVTLSESDESSIKSSFYSGLLTSMPNIYLSIQTLIFELNAFFNTKVSLDIQMKIPLNAGLGASASIASAIVLAYYKHFNQTLDSVTHIKWIQLSEMIAHGRASGIDATAMTLKTPFIFKKDTPFTPFETNLDAHMLIVFSNVSGKTKEAVNHLEILHKEHTKETEERFKILSEVTETLLKSIELKAHDVIGDMMNRAHHVLKSLHLSHKEVDRLVDICLKHKAHGAKLTGGGLGGCMIAYYTDLDALHQTIKEVENKGFHTYFIQKV